MNRLRGDTIIEVVLAISLFSLVAVGAMTIMNRGLALSQRSLETTLVRQQLDAQAEMLRYVHSQSSSDDYFAALWSSIVSRQVDSPMSVIGTSSCPSSMTGVFFLYPTTSSVELGDNYSPAGIYAEVYGMETRGVSIQLTKSQGEHAYDAHIQACWDSPGGNRPMTIGTIVRLYDAR